MDPKPSEPILPFATSDDLARWLAKHHKTVPVLWIKYAKKSSGEPSINWTQAVDVALCYGWIDGQSKSLDDRYHLQRFTPRGPKSKWSKINRDRIDRLIAEGRMRAAGLAEVERAKADGRWDAAYDSPKTAEVPPELARALDRNAAAKAAFDALTAMQRYSLLYRLQTAKRAETRARLVEQFVTTLAATPVKTRATARRRR